MDSAKNSGLYIHIPFCLSKCPYCDFYSSTSIPSIPDFLDALFKEMERYGHRFDPFDTVYLGGGTPSLLSPKQLEDILMNGRKNFHLISNAEITLEANPADLNQSLLESILEIGFNRINIGIQSFDEKVLDFLGRRHSVRQAISAIEASRKAGFHNIGLDLIYGIPGQDMASWFDTLKQAVAFSPEHLSCYQLTFEPKTPLGRRFQAGEFSVPGEELQYEFFMKTSQFLEHAGYIHYEVSNFARGMEYSSRHNQKYWDHSPYLGLGPAAHSFQGNQRWWNHRSLDQYLASVHAGNPPVLETESLTKEQFQLEALYLGLRTKKGISLQDFKVRYGLDLLCAKQNILEKLEEEGLISIQDGRLHPTPTGLAITDSLALI
ncbi:MAG: radical SAM family heme chaperone HemW [Deltaproteobacteria bacterium]|nr:radical SAM family heme chaperone HemW [Deltaproteobacteria bacterium]